MNSVEATNWIHGGDIEDGHQEYKSPATDDLADKELNLFFDSNNWIINYSFHDAGSLTWKIVEGKGEGESYTDTYEAFAVASNIYFVDFVRKDLPDHSVTMVLDLNNSKATAMFGYVPDMETVATSFINRMEQGLNLSVMKMELSHANINPASRDEAIVPHERTTELIGKSVKCRYSHDTEYEEIFHNSSFYTWHCLKGPQKGLSDTEFSHFFKIDSGVFLIIWLEKVLPLYGIEVHNYNEMRTIGKLFGRDLASERIVNFSTGGYIEHLTDKNL